MFFFSLSQELCELVPLVETDDEETSSNASEDYESFTETSSDQLTDDSG